MKFNVTVGLNENETKLAQAADFINLAIQALSIAHLPDQDIPPLGIMEVLSVQMRAIIHAMIGQGMCDADEVSYTMQSNECSFRQALQENCEATLHSILNV